VKFITGSLKVISGFEAEEAFNTNALKANETRRVALRMSLD
jgi:hypothetical protein